jgi:hypothetical protein
MQIVVVQGHYPGPEELCCPVWTGSLDLFCATNPGLDPDEIAQALGPSSDRFHQIGGGAEAEFTVYALNDWPALVAALAAQRSALDLPDETEEQRFWHEAATERGIDHWNWARENHEDGPDGDSRIGAGW